MKGEIRELKEGMIALRDDIHGLRGDLRRQERAIASLEVDIDRINSRLGLSEALESDSKLILTGPNVG